MSIDPKHGRYCDECGRVIVKAHRIHNGRDYCSTCYPRVFTKAPCSQCGASARVHHHDESEPLCAKCLRQGRICVRCSKPVDKAGKISDGKPVCASCAPYFREQSHCSGCGKLSSRLSSMPSAGVHDRLCESCRNEFTHKTCSVCRKYRKVAGMDISSKPRCASCLPGVEIAHACPTCGAEVPGSGASRCRGCLNIDAVEREGRMVAALMTRDWTKPLVRQFAQWLLGRRPDMPNLVKLFRSHQSAFERIDAQFELRESATAEAILGFFGTAGLREHLLVGEFLTESLGIEFSAQLKSDVAEQSRIEEKLRQCQKRPWRNVVDGYYAWLRDCKLPVRTIRLYLSTAVAFCEAAQIQEQAWQESATSAFLRQQPGLRNNLSKFVGHCRRKYGWDVALPPRAEQPASDATKKLVAELRKLTKQVSRDGLESTGIKVLEKIIAKSLAFRIGDIARATQEQFIDDAGKRYFQSGDDLILIPAELDNFFIEYVRRRKAGRRGKFSPL